MTWQTSQIASGLHYLHSQRPAFIHGDLRAVRCLFFTIGKYHLLNSRQGNILVDEFERPLIADFGLSRMRTIQTNIHTGDGIGTVRWQAPETLDATENKGHRSTASDIYAFAMTCFEVSKILFGKSCTLPFVNNF